ncbi:MAG: C-type lectin domain-containing protein, partial [Oscillospiraceae bacterium]|nr:C-type lectin domain-containing protein [Oscillospiraceae bacterium]
PEQIPELYFLSCSDATGEAVATWHDKHLVTLGLSNTNAADYIETSGLLYHHPSKATNSPATVYELKNGVFEKIASGAYWWDSTKANDDRITMDSRNRPANVYEWAGKSVSEQEFDQNLNAVYNTERSIRPQDWYPVDEMLSILETGKHLSATHRYEFITADVSWTEAQALCRKNGGYLAVITAPEERRTILRQLKEQNLTESLFFVGYQVNPERWILADQSEVPAGNLINFWEYQAPDYSFMEPEFEIQECGILKYYPETDQIYLFAAPDELISTLPDYAGKIGYVCEYDN